MAPEEATEAEEEWQDAAEEQQSPASSEDGGWAERPAWNERDLSSLPLCSVSSHKAGFGVRELMDPSTQRFWQSDGPQPHWIRLQFPRRMPLVRLALYLAPTEDESYTPARLSIRLGTGPACLQDLDGGVVEVDLESGDGWMEVDLRDGEGAAQYASTLHLVILANHQNGKDTHLRGLRVFGPNPAARSTLPAGEPMEQKAEQAEQKDAEEGSSGASVPPFLTFGPESLWSLR